MLASQIDSTEHDVAMATVEAELRSESIPARDSAMAILEDASNDARTAFIEIIGGRMRLLGAALPLSLLGALIYL